MTLSVVGHIAIDTVKTRNGSNERLGGPPSYISSLHAILGNDINVVTRVGQDLPVEYINLFKTRGVDLKPCIVDSPTTRFSLDYSTDPRGIGYDAVCDPIPLTDIPDSGCIIVSPIVGEVKAEYIPQINVDFLSLDTQGWVRYLRGDGSITSKNWYPPSLENVDLLKTSLSEHRYLSEISDLISSLDKISKMGPKVTVITLGEAGSIVKSEDLRIKVQSFCSIEVDSTGAGDCFLGALSYMLQRGEPLEWSCAYASAVSSTVVETVGPYMQAGKTEINERAESVYEKVTPI